LALPPGVVASPLGTAFANQDASIMVAVMTGAAEAFRKKSQFDQRLYPEPIEAFRSGTLAGTVRHRTRKLDGGTWDGWVLQVVRGEKVMEVMITFQGADEKTFADLKQVIYSVSWDDRVMDPELAFGLKLDPPGLKLEKTGTGALAYSVDGLTNPDEPNLFLSTIPVRSKATPETFHLLCEKTVPVAFRGAPSRPLQYVTSSALSLCDSSGAPASAGAIYSAVVQFPDGAVVTAFGRGNPEDLRHSLLGAKRLRQ
jgi:hypothetical protein